MSLRARLTVAVAALVAVAVAVTGWVVIRGAERELVQEVDAFIETRIERLSPNLVNNGGPLGRIRGRNAPEIRIGREFSEALSEDDASTQLITAEGTILAATSVELPISDADLAVAAGDRGPTPLRTVSVDGSRYRVQTAPIGQLGAVMVGRDLNEVDAALAGLRQRTLVLGLIGSVMAAALAWALATRLARPIDQVTVAAEHVATTQDLSASIEVSGGGEAARLATSFNTMLGALNLSRQQQHRLVMDASHELRTPLTSLRTNVDVMRRAKTMSLEDRDEVLSDVSAEIDELTGLVSELVELATSSSANEEEAVELDLVAMAQAVASRAQRRHAGPIEVIDSHGSMVLGQHSRIERAITNLVDNAAKFSPPSGPILIDVKGGRVAVGDRGPGVSDADKVRIFDRFYRSVATRSAPGSGLGLSIVADVVEAHGGTVFVYDQPDGPGAIVGFELPPLQASPAS